MSQSVEPIWESAASERRRRIPPPWVIFWTTVVLVVTAICLIFGRRFVDNHALIHKVESARGSVRFDESRPEWLRNMMGTQLQSVIDPITVVYVPPRRGNERIVREIVAALPDQTSVRHLSLDLTDAELSQLALPNLTALGLFETTTDTGIAHLTRFPELRALNFDGCRITEAGLRHLRHLKLLEDVSFLHCGVTDAGISQLSKLPLVTHIQLVDCLGITDESLQHIGRLPRLNYLRLLDCAQLTDRGLTGLQDSPVQVLSLLNCTGITGSGMEHLKDNSSLSGVEIFGAHCTDEVVEHLQLLRHVKWIALIDTSISEAGVERLRATLPTCQVVHGRISTRATRLKTSP